MYIKKITLAVMTINFMLVAMGAYAIGNYKGSSTTTATVDQVAINYAIYQALNEK